MTSSCLPGNGVLQSLCIAPLITPTRLGPYKLFSQPQEPWELHGVGVNEGPAAFYRNGKTYLAYSGSYCWTQYYALGYLTVSTFYRALLGYITTSTDRRLVEW